MFKETLVPSEETKQYFSELSLPDGLNGNEANVEDYWALFADANKTFKDLVTLNETYRRMQDFYSTINSGRFCLVNAQRKHYLDIISSESPAWANDWIKSQYVNSAIQAYSASFDFYLQMLWISFELYKQYPKHAPGILSDDNLNGILGACNINRVEKQISILGDQLSDRIEQFHSSVNCKEVRDLCKQIKHRRTIQYVELADYKPCVMIKSDIYNTHNTLPKFHIEDIICKLKQFHKNLTDLSNYTIPIVFKRLN